MTQHIKASTLISNNPTELTNTAKIKFRGSLWRKIPKTVWVWPFFGAATLIFLWPIPFNIATHATDTVDPLLLSYVLGSEKQNLLAGDFAHFLASPAFFPYPDTLVYSDHSLTLTLLSLPVALFSDNPILAHNFVLLLGWFLCGLGGFYLTFHYTRSYPAALVGGLIIGFNPYHYTQLNHLQTNSYEFMLFSLLFLEKSIAEKRKSNYFFFILFTILAFWVTFYHIAFLLVIFSFVLIFRLVIGKELRNWRKLGALAGCIVVVALANLPLILPYLHFSEEMNAVRTIQETSYGSADFRSYVSANLVNWLWGFTARNRIGDPLFTPEDHALFVGVAVWLLALIGFAAKGDKNLPTLRGNRVQVMFFLTLLAAILLSKGPFLSLSNQPSEAFHNNTLPLPYKFLYDNVILFQGLRMPARFMLVVVVCLAVLAAFSFKRLYYSKGKGKWLGLGLVGLMLIEFWPGSIPQYKIENPYPQSYAFLAQQAGTDWGLYEFPASPLYDRYSAYFALSHGKRVLNGYNGFEPEGMIRLEELSNNRFNSNTATVLEILSGLKVKYLMIHGDRIKDKVFMEQLLASLGQNENARLVFQHDADYIYQLPDRSAQFSTSQDITISLSRTFISDGKLYTEAVIRNKGTQVWTNPNIGLYQLQVKVGSSEIHKSLALPLYLLPGEEVRQQIRLNPPFGWSQNLGEVKARVELNEK